MAREHRRVAIETCRDARGVEANVMDKSHEDRVRCARCSLPARQSGILRG